MPLPMTQDLATYRGDSFLVQVRLWEDAAKTQPCDLTGATLLAQIRQQQDATSIVTEFGLTVAGNVVSLLLTPDQAKTLPARSVWDLEVDWTADRTNVQTVVRGALTADPDVTRPGEVLTKGPRPR